MEFESSDGGSINIMDSLEPTPLYIILHLIPNAHRLAQGFDQEAS
jgi:hypothetical protein